MKFHSLSPILVVMSMAAFPFSATAQGNPPRCFHLQLGPWSPSLELGADTVFIQPPARVRFDTAVGTAGFERGRRLLRPARGSVPSVHRFGYWTVNDSGQVALLWTTGFSGLRMRLGAATIAPFAATDTLRGTAQTFWDFERPTQIASVVAVPITCSAARQSRPEPSRKPERPNSGSEAA